MRLTHHLSARRLLLAITAAAFLALVSIPSHAQDDPPSQTGRISYASGTVSIQEPDSDDWGQAMPNLPFAVGDRIVTDRDGRAELQIAQSYIRIGPNSDVSYVGDNPGSISIGVAQGTVHVHSLGLWPGQRFVINTPSGTGGIDTAGEEIRVDVLPDQDAAIFTNDGIQAFAGGPGMGYVTIHRGQALELLGSNPVIPQWLQPADYDNLDIWSQQRDRQMVNSVSYQYVSPEIPGASELDANGSWLPDSDYGPIWFPNNVSPGWAPYHYGHWVNHAPWGWVWVEDESWGYAPFHYGRWVSYHGRWGWIPGARAAHPVWSPALVVFAGGIHVGAAGVSAWFPLGPGEAYHPWYHASPHYIDQINTSGIRESRLVHVQPSYVNINFVNNNYVNRTIGVTAMRHEDFAAGRSAHDAHVVVDVHLFDHVQVIDRPEVQPTPHFFAGHQSMRPVPVRAERPTFINESGKLVSTKPGFQPVAPPTRTVPQVRVLPGHIEVAPPQGARARDRMMNAPATPSANPTPLPANQPSAPATGNRPAQSTPVNPPDARGPYSRQTPPANQPAPPTPATRPAPPTPVNPPAPQAPNSRPTPPGNQPAPPAVAKPATRPAPPTPVNPPAPQAPYSRPTPPANQPAPPAVAKPAPNTPGSKPQPDNRNKDQKNEKKDVPKP